MKLLHVLSKIDPALGGVSQAVRTMVSGLSEVGIVNEVVSLDAPDAPFLSADADAFTMHVLGPAKGPWQYSSKLRNWLDENLNRFDAVVVHGLWLYHGFAVQQAVKSLRHSSHAKVPKLFVMPHGMLDPYFQRASGRKLKAARNWAYWKLIERWLVNEADGILFTCEEERLLAAEPFQPYQPQQELVVGLGVEAPPAYIAAMRTAFRQRCPGSDERPYLLFIGRVHEKKGVDLLLDAFAEMVGKAARPLALATDEAASECADDITASDYLPHLVIAGPGLDTPYGEALQKRVRDSVALQPCVSFPGMLTDDAKWGAFYGCEAFILPSHQENFGIAVVEALACGKPVLISNQVNIWQQILTDKAGMVADDTQDGTNSLLSAWHHLSYADRQIMGERALACFQARFAVKPAARRLLKALQLQ